MLSEDGRQRGILAFGLGVVVAYVTVGIGAGFIAMLMTGIHLIDATLAGALMTAGCMILWHEGPRACEGREHHVPLGSAFVLGAMSAVVVSPCCTPFAIAIVGLGAGLGDPIQAVGMLASFAFGHMLPVIAAGVSGGGLARRLRVIAGSDAMRIVGASLTIALGAYYGLLV
jgi:thiol:disulfide interchange protein DsbD